MKIKAILFDLDGTLLDTAPTFCNIINELITGLTITPCELRPHVATGGKGMLNYAKRGHSIEELEVLYAKFLHLYKDNMFHATCFLPEIENTLNHLTRNNIPWGIVSNKAEKFVHTLCQYFKPLNNAKVLIGGDSTPNRKPSPIPLLHACRKIAIEACDCLYVGDAKTDIIAGKNAGMLTAVANFGYIDKNTNPISWQADMIFDSPKEILELI